MRIISLVLENYRKFKHVAIEFEDGVIGIIGLNGVGKSTLIEAIAFALYGHNASRTNKEEIKRANASHLEPCRVTLEFELEGSEYKVMREMVGAKLDPNAKVFINNRLEVEGATPVTNYITRMLGMDRESFFTSVFAKQKELNALSTLKGHERRSLVRKMLNIDAIDDALAKIREDKRNKEEQIKGMRRMLLYENGKPKFEKLRAERESKDKERSSLKNQLESLKSEEERKRSEVEKFEKEWNEQESMYEKFNDLKFKLEGKKKDYENQESQRNKRKMELERLMQAKERLKDIEFREGEYRDAKEEEDRMKELRSKHEEKERVMREIEKIRSDVRELERKIADDELSLKRFEGLDDELKRLRERRQSLKVKKGEIDEEIGRISAQIAGKEDEKRSTERKRKKIENLGKESECPTCERPLGEHYEVLINKFEREILESKTQIEELKEKLESRKNEKEELVRIGEALERRERDLNSQGKEKAKIEERLSERKKILSEKMDELELKEESFKQLEEVEWDENAYKALMERLSELEKIHDQIIVLRNEVKKIPDIESDIRELEEKLSELEDAIKELEEKIADMKFSKEERDKAWNRFNECRKMHYELKLRLQDRMNELKNLENAIEEIDKQIKELEKMQELIKEEEKEIQYLIKLDEVMDKFRIDLISRIRPMLSSYASELFRKLTDGRYTELELDENYNIFIYDNGRAYELSRFSGGEGDLANLCLRLAISQVIAEKSGRAMNFVILDEIFGSQDAYRKRNIMLALNELSKQFRQIFLITHVEDIKDYMGYVLSVEEDDEGISSVRVLNGVYMDVQT